MEVMDVRQISYGRICKENGKLDKSKPDGARMMEEKQIALFLNMLQLTYGTS